jgi:hypothetical protein
MTKPTDADYARTARSLAETLMRFARDRRTEDQKEAGALQSQLCQMRRAELAEPVPEPPTTEPSP